MAEYVCEQCGDSFDRPEALGGHVTLAHKSNHGTSADTLKRELQEVSEALGKTPTAEEMRQHECHSIRTYQKYFGSWNDAIRAAGLTPNCRKRITPEELLEDLHRVADDLGRVPSSVDIKRHSEFCYTTYREHIGEWEEVLRTAGYEPRRSYVDSDTMSYGPNWSKQRQRALERDNYTCQTPGCEVTREEHIDKTGVDLHVHHLKPFEYFVDQYGEKAHRHGNKLSNLLTVCSNHHPHWEVFSAMALWLFGLW